MIPKEVIVEISRWLVYSCAIGKSDISGEDWGDFFAKAVQGDHLSSPVGLADVVAEGKAWSVKSVKHNTPHRATIVRVISGRNSVDYSYGITDSREDPQKTGNAVLGIWNERVNIALDKFDSLRTSILVRNIDTLELTLFETDTPQYVQANYIWTLNKNDNLVGHDITTKKHKFTWQPHGAQFTVKYPIPASAIKFRIKRPHILDFDTTMKELGFEDSWVQIEDNQ